MDQLRDAIMGCFYCKDERTPSQIVDHCHGAYPPTAVKAKLLEMILSEELELTPGLTVKLKSPEWAKHWKPTSF